MKTFIAASLVFVASSAFAQDPSGDPNLVMRSDNSAALPKAMAKEIKSATAGIPKKPAATNNDEIDVLFREPVTKLRQPASTIPEELAALFVVSAPDRAPAAAPKSRRSRVPANVSDGFELRSRYNTLNSMFWVIKREDRYNLVYSNSAGSKASHDLSIEAFRSLHNFANGFKAFEGNINKCKDSSIQLHVISNGKERTVTTCLTDKSKSAEGLRNLGNMLAAMVR